MSGLSESGGSGLSDWALVNSQGELEGSDADSNTSSIEVVGREGEVEEDVGRDDLASRESSPECIELEELLKTSDAAARADNSAGEDNPAAEPEEGAESLKQGHERVTLPPFVSTQQGLGAMAAYVQQPAVETVGACSPENLERTEKRAPSEEAERSRERQRVTKPGLASQVSQESDCLASSESALSASAASVTSRSSRADSDSESDFVRLEKDWSCVSTESEGEELQSMLRANPMIASGSSVGSGFNFLCSTRAVLQQPPWETQQTPPPPPLPQPLLASLQQPLLLAVPHSPENQAADPLLPPPPPPPPLPPPQEDMASPPERDALHPDAQPDPEEIIRRMDAQEEDEEGEGVGVEEEGEEEIVEEGEEVVHAGQQEEVAEDVDVEEGEEGEVVQNEGEDVDDDADTESSTEEGDQDDRIESEQSDDAHSAPPDDLEQVDLSVVNDIGDLPVVRGDVERHYIHYNNQQLNGRLNRVVLAMLVLALGMGLGHWIGSTREHFSQLEIQLSQMKRLHQMQDEYMQCLARNDELLVNSDVALQNERERHQEAMADLRDNNRELQEQLQDAQDHLEHVLAASARVPRASQQQPSSLSLAHDLQYALTLSKLLVAGEDQFRDSLLSWGPESQQQLQQARLTFSQAMEERLVKHRSLLEKRLRQEAAEERLLKHRSLLEERLRQEAAEERRANQDLQMARQRLNQRLNFLEVENADLRMEVGKMRYRAGTQAAGESAAAPEFKPPHPSLSRDPLPPPPRPLPPPPFADAMDVQRALERRQNKPGGPSGTGTQTTNHHHPNHHHPNHPNYHQQEETSHNSADPLFHLFPEDLTSEAVDSTPVPMASAQEESTEASADEAIERGREAVLEGEKEEEGRKEAEGEKSDEEGEGSDDHGASIAKSACSSGETVPRPIPVDVTLLQRNLTQERQRAEMWRHLYLWEREGRRGMNASACLQFLLREVNMTRLMQTLGHWNLTGVGMDGVKDLTSLVTSMARLHQHLLHSLPALWHDLSANLDDLHGDLSQPEPPPSESDPEEKGAKEEEEGGGEEKVRGDSPPPHTPWSEGVKTLLNKTRGTLSNVSRHLKQTWNQVKDVSRHLWPGDDSVLGRLAARVKDGMNKLSHRMKGTAHKKRSKRAKQGWKKKRQEAFSGGEESGKEEGRERVRDRDSQEKESRKDHQKKTQFQQKKGDTGGKKWKTERPQNGGGGRPHDFEEKSGNVSSHQKEHSHHGRKEHSNKHHHQTSDKKDGKNDEQFHKRDPKDADHKESKNETPEKHYQNDSQKKYAKRYHHSENQREPRFKDKEGKKNHWKENVNKKNEEQKYRRDDVEKDGDKRKKQDKDRRRGDHTEQQFSTKAKHHSSHAEKAADKAKHKMQKRFHKLFTKIGAMNQKSFQAMESDDLADMLEDITKVSVAYSDSKHLGLPHSGFLWLQCQHHFFWGKAERGRVRHEPEEGCLQLLAPWQMGFVVDLRERVRRGECRKERTISCAEGQSSYEYICSEDDRYHDGIDRDDDDDDDNVDDSRHTSQKQESKAFPKGQRERENSQIKATPQEPWNSDSTKESANRQVNHSEQDSQAWYFHWVEGRNNLRSVEHKADWLFERAQERDETREQERKANWMFERASERDKLREEGQTAEWKFEGDADRYAGYEEHDDDDEEEEDEMEDKHGRWREGVWREKHGHRKDGHFHRHRKHHWHRDMPHNIKHQEKDYRQKYGRAHSGS